jgi:predicted DNA-binding transcriptional regulator AlpA
MTLREREVAARRRLHRKQSSPAQVQVEHRDKVMSFAQWCRVNSFSKPTGRRIIKRGEGPPVIRLSPRRIGIRESDNRAWQDSRTR